MGTLARGPCPGKAVRDEWPCGAPWRRRSGPGVSRRGHRVRLDVLVEVEQVVGVVAALDLGQPAVVGAVVLGCPVLLVTRGEVGVPARLRVRRDGGEVVANP